MASAINNAAQAAASSLPAAPKPLFTGLRDYVKDPHPFARNPTTLRSAPVPWMLYAKRQVRTAAIFVPFMMVVLGWPMAAKALVSASNGVETGERKFESKKIVRRGLLQEGPVRHAEE